MRGKRASACRPDEDLGIDSVGRSIPYSNGRRAINLGSLPAPARKRQRGRIRSAACVSDVNQLRDEFRVFARRPTCSGRLGCHSKALRRSTERKAGRRSIAILLRNSCHFFADTRRNSVGKALGDHIRLTLSDYSTENPAYFGTQRKGVGWQKKRTRMGRAPFSGHQLYGPACRFTRMASLHHSLTMAWPPRSRHRSPPARILDLDRRRRFRRCAQS